MKIAILHLTDIHFTEKTDLNHKINSLCRVILNDTVNIGKLYIVLSGDIVFSGQKNEYDKARKYFSVLKTMLTGERKGLLIRFVIVPGNHDCNFTINDTQLRKNSIKNINYDSIGTDNSVIDLCTKVQDEF